MNYDLTNELEKAEIYRANQLIEKGMILGEKGQKDDAMNLLIDAVNIFLDNGIYLKIADTFSIIVSLVNYSTHIFPIQEKIHQIIQTLEYLDLDEEIAKLKLNLANLAYKTEDYLTAGNLYIEVADLFFNVDPEEYRQVSGMFLLRAGECFEKIFKTERGERLVFQAIRRFDTSNFNYKEEISILQNSITKRKYNAAIDELREIGQFFRTLEVHLENTLELSDEFASLKQNVKARLFHMISEYNFLKMLCYKMLADNDNVEQQAKKIIGDLREAIHITKAEVKSGMFSSMDLERLIFDILLLQIVQEFAQFFIEDPVDLASRDLNQDIQDRIQKYAYYDYMTHIVDYDLDKNLDLIEEMTLPQILRPFQDFILKAIQKG